jgi:hypothetical protein
LCGASPVFYEKLQMGSSFPQGEEYFSLIYMTEDSNNNDDDTNTLVDSEQAVDDLGKHIKDIINMVEDSNNKDDDTNTLDDWGLVSIFVPGAPVVISENIVPEVGLANGTTCVFTFFNNNPAGQIRIRKHNNDIVTYENDGIFELVQKNEEFFVQFLEEEAMLTFLDDIGISEDYSDYSADSLLLLETQKSMEENDANLLSQALNNLNIN